MKKIKLISIIAAMAIVAVMFASCSDVPDFTKTKYAKEAFQTITLTDGETVVYTEERHYSDGVVEIKTKKLSSDAYTESFTEEETQKTYEKIPYFDVYRRKYYKGGVSESVGGTLKFKVNERKLGELLGLDKSEVSGDVTVTANSVNETSDTIIIEYKTKTGKNAKIVTKYVFEEDEQSPESTESGEREESSYTDEE